MKCEGHEQHITEIFGLTAGNDLRVKLACDHRALIDRGGWVMRRGEPTVVADTAYCYECEAGCSECGSGLHRHRSVYDSVRGDHPRTVFDGLPSLRGHRWRS